MDDIKETAWDHLSGEKTATLSTSEKKWIRMIESLKEKYPDQVDIRCRNADGSIVVRLPVCNPFQLTIGGRDEISLPLLSISGGIQK